MLVEVLLDLLESKVNNGTPTNSWWMNKVEWAVKCKRFAESGVDDHDVFTWKELQAKRAQFRDQCMSISGYINQALVEFCRLLVLDNDLFQCCQNPDVICVDGIVISIETRRILASQLSHPWLIGNGKAKRATDRPTRHIWNGTKSERESMLIYAQVGIKEQEYHSLLESTAQNPELCNAITEFSIFNGELYTCVPELYYLFRSLGKDVMPACQFLPKCTWSAVSDYLNGIVDEGFGLVLETYAPIMAYT